MINIDESLIFFKLLFNAFAVLISKGRHAPFVQIFLEKRTAGSCAAMPMISVRLVEIFLFYPINSFLNPSRFAP